MLDLKLEDIDGILVRYNVALEKEMTPDEAAEELYPKDDLRTYAVKMPKT